MVCDTVNCSVVSDSVTLWNRAHQAPLSMGFSRQEYWSGLPCPPPGNLPNPGIEPRSPTLQVDSLLTEPPWEPKNTGMGSCSLLQAIFPAQGSNPGLPHCRQILHQLSHQESTCLPIYITNWAFQVALLVKNAPANARDTGSIPGLGRFPGEGNGNLLQYSCLGNPMDRDAWQVTVHRVTKNQARLHN